MSKRVNGRAEDVRAGDYLSSVDGVTLWLRDPMGGVLVEHVRTDDFPTTTITVWANGRMIELGVDPVAEAQYLRDE